MCVYILHTTPLSDYDLQNLFLTCVFFIFLAFFRRTDSLNADEVKLAIASHPSGVVSDKYLLRNFTKMLLRCL